MATNTDADSGAGHDATAGDVELTVAPERSDDGANVLVPATAQIGDDPVAAAAAFLDGDATHDDVDALVEDLRSELHYYVKEVNND